MKRINVFFIAILVLIFNIVLVYSVIGYLLESPMWMFTDDNISTGQGATAAEPVIEDEDATIESGNNNVDAVDSDDYRNVFSPDDCLEKNENAMIKEPVTENYEMSETPEDEEEVEILSDILSESLGTGTPYPLDGLLNLGVLSYFDGISMTDKLASLAIAAKIGSENIIKIANIVQKGIDDHELDEISEILSQCLTKEEMEMLKKMVSRYMDKIYEVSKVEFERLQRAMSQ